VNAKVFYVTQGIVLPVNEDILAHRASIQCPMRIQSGFLKLIAMSSKCNSRSHILKRLASSVRDGASNSMSSA